MSVGLISTKQDLDARAGALARAFQSAFVNVNSIKAYLDRTPDADLEALGYTPGEVAGLKTAFSDLAQLGNIWVGAVALPAAKDFRVFVQQLWGIGTQAS